MEGGKQDKAVKHTMNVHFFKTNKQKNTLTDNATEGKCLWNSYAISGKVANSAQMTYYLGACLRTSQLDRFI